MDDPYDSIFTRFITTAEALTGATATITLTSGSNNPVDCDASATITGTPSGNQSPILAVRCIESGGNTPSFWARPPVSARNQLLVSDIQSNDFYGRTSAAGVVRFTTMLGYYNASNRFVPYNNVTHPTLDIKQTPLFTAVNTILIPTLSIREDLNLTTPNWLQPLHRLDANGITGYVALGQNRQISIFEYTRDTRCIYAALRD